MSWLKEAKNRGLKHADEEERARQQLKLNQKNQEEASQRKIEVREKEVLSFVDFQFRDLLEELKDFGLDVNTGDKTAVSLPYDQRKLELYLQVIEPHEPHQGYDVKGRIYYFTIDAYRPDSRLDTLIFSLQILPLGIAQENAKAQVRVISDSYNSDCVYEELVSSENVDIVIKQVRQAIESIIEAKASKIDWLFHERKKNWRIKLQERFRGL